LIVGLVQLGTGVLILGRKRFGLRLGVGIAGFSVPMTVFVIFLFPRWRWRS
jgi:hypothetical protein